MPVSLVDGLACAGAARRRVWRTAGLTSDPPGGQTWADLQDTQIFSLALGLDGTPWFVKEVRLDREARRLDWHLDFKAGTRFNHAIHSPPSPVHDTVQERWRPMNFFPFESDIHARVFNDI